jgi:hypothetical protein
LGRESATVSLVSARGTDHGQQGKTNQVARHCQQQDAEQNAHRGAPPAHQLVQTSHALFLPEFEFA